ncbi:MAG: TatD family hydrolase [Nanoarchaeota archaeon]|nr:TatD family hydrolase [Nanoarchaeota archaeon]
MYIDIHCHLDVEQFEKDLGQVIKNAEQADLKVILTNGTNSDSNKAALKLAKKYDLVRAALGIYPEHAHELDVDQEIEFIKKHKDEIVAIGEVGLDGIDKTNFEEQKKCFQKMIDLAKELDLPVVIHSRKAESVCIEMLQASKIKKVLLHCFCGKKKLIERAAKLGYYFSVPTNVVRAENFQSLIRNVPITQLFAETDAPWLSPFKEKRNEPAFVVESYKEIAKQKKMDPEEVKKSIFMNWQKLF